VFITGQILSRLFLRAGWLALAVSAWSQVVTQAAPPSQSASSSLPAAPVPQSDAQQPFFIDRDHMPAALLQSSLLESSPSPPQSNPEIQQDVQSKEKAHHADIWHRKYLFGDWNGKRMTLERKGITFDFYYMADALGNPYGGRADLGVWGRIRGTMDVDFSKFTNWQGLTFHITGLWQYGTDLSNQYTFTVVNSSSLPSAHTLRGDSYYFQQYLLHNKLALRGGQIAGYDTYGNSEYGASFINLALGYAHINLNPGFFLAFNPAGVPSFEVKVLPTHHFYAKGMVQSEERDPYRIDPSGFTFHLGGPVVVTETGYIHNPPRPPHGTGTMGSEPFIKDSETGNYPGVYRFGAGYNPHNFLDPLTGRSSPGNYLLYWQISQAVYRMGKVGEDRNRGLDLIYSQDYAPGDVTQYNQQIMAGARWLGVFPRHWSNDSLALGYVHTSVGSHYREAQLLAGKPKLTSENLIEVNYLANLTPWLIIQPVVQWFVQPGADASRSTVFVTGFRTKITF
jgi:porin